MILRASRRTTAALFIATAALPWATVAIAAGEADAAPATSALALLSTPMPAEGRTAEPHDRPFVTSMGQPIGVSSSGAANLTNFARPTPYDSATFERRVTTGNTGVLNLAWRALRPLGDD